MAGIARIRHDPAMTNRKLNLKRETLSALTSDDLQVVAGASGAESCAGTCLEPRCHVVIYIGPSIKPTCQGTLCYGCPIG